MFNHEVGFESLKQADQSAVVLMVDFADEAMKGWKPSAKAIFNRAWVRPLLGDHVAQKPRFEPVTIRGRPPGGLEQFVVQLATLDKGSEFVELPAVDQDLVPQVWTERFQFGEQWGQPGGQVRR